MSNILQRQNAFNNIPKIKRLFFILTVLFIFPLPQVAIDLYLPSLPAMAKYFHAPNFLLQLSLTVYILSLGIAQLIYGPCSDRFGRKPVLLIGTSIFLLGSIVCAFATSITQLLIFRIIQGIGMGCGFTVASAILGDTFSGAKLARMTTFSSMVYSLSPLLAPIIGGYLQHYFGWRANFALIAIFSGIILIAIMLFIFKTNDRIDKNALSAKRILFNYWTMLINFNFIGNILCLTLTFGIMITFNVVGPFLLQNVLKVSVVNYGLSLFLVGLAYLFGTFCNSQLLKFIKINLAIMFGVSLMILFSCALLIAAWLDWFSPASVLTFTCLVIFSTGFVFPNCFAKALEIFPDKLGAASAIIGSGGLFGVSLISGIVAHVPYYTESALGLIFLIQAILCLIIFSFNNK